MKALAGPQVDVTGFVSDAALQQYYAEARVAVAHRGVFGGRDPIALTVGRMTVALRRAHARAMQVEAL